MASIEAEFIPSLPVQNGETPVNPESDSLEYQTIIRNAPSPPPVDASLDDAIGTASSTELRRLLLDITHDNEAARNVAKQRLLTPIAGANSRKRKAFEACKNCAAEYQVTNNVSGDCVYHSGRKEENHDCDIWVDMYKSDEEPDADDPEMQEYFMWTCCNQQGDAEGCVVTRHAPVTDDTRVRRLQ